MVDRSLKQEKLPDTDVTLAYLEQTLVDFSNQKDVQLINWRSEPLEGGFTSKVVRVQLEWSKNDTQMPDQVVVKAASAASVDEIFDKIGHDRDDQEKSEHRVMTSEQIARMINRTEYETYRILSAVSGAVPIPRIYGCEPGLIWRSRLPGPDQVADLFACYVDIVRKGLKPTIEKYSDYYGHMAESIYEKSQSIFNSSMHEPTFLLHNVNSSQKRNFLDEPIRGFAPPITFQKRYPEQDTPVRDATTGSSPKIYFIFKKLESLWKLIDKI
uniref:Uncharacterized protein n=1 Tax=Romanomermis culicivorax TaxID=13658 RepID=A0A915JY30_ROMCU